MPTTPTVQEYTTYLDAHNFFSTHHTHQHDYTTTSLQDPTAFIDHDFAYHQAFETFANLPDTLHSAYAELGDGLENVLGVLDEALWAAESSGVDGVIEALIAAVDDVCMMAWHIKRFQERLLELNAEYRDKVRRWSTLKSMTEGEIRGKTAMKAGRLWESWDEKSRETAIEEERKALEIQTREAANARDLTGGLVGRIEDWGERLVRKRDELLGDAGEMPQHTAGAQDQHGLRETQLGQNIAVASGASLFMTDDDWILPSDEDEELDLGEGDSSMGTLEAPEEEVAEPTVPSSSTESAGPRSHGQEQHASAATEQAGNDADVHLAEKKDDNASASDDVDALAERLADLDTKSKEKAKKIV